MNRFTLPVPQPHDLAALLATLPAGQRRVAEAFVAEPWGRTRGETAAALGVHVGTVHRHLARIRGRRPAIYAALMARRRATRRYIFQHIYGCEPWER